MATSIYDTLNEFIERVAVGGRSALSEREHGANDVAELMYKIVAGVAGFLYNTSEERKRQLVDSVNTLGLPAFP
jgi:hypothetical protein